MIHWRLLLHGACLVVLVDQRTFLANVEEPPHAFWRATGRRFAHAEARVFGPVGLQAGEQPSTIEAPRTVAARR